jgi:uncharacterized protein (TIGR00369 family)
MSEPDRPLPSPDQLHRYAEEFNASRSLKALGARISFPSPGLVRVDVEEARPEFLGGLGSAEAVNGALLAALFDLVIGCSAALVDPTRRSATVQLSMSFERPLVGRRLHAEAEVTTAGGRTLFSAARIRDAEGNVCARCNGVVRMSTQPWDSGTSPAIN